MFTYLVPVIFLFRAAGIIPEEFAIEMLLHVLLTEEARFSSVFSDTERVWVIACIWGGCILFSFVKLYYTQPKDCTISSEEGVVRGLDTGCKGAAHPMSLFAIR